MKENMLYLQKCERNGMMHKIKSSHENLRGRPGTLKMCAYPASFQSGLGEEKHQNIRPWTIVEHGWNATIVFNKIQKKPGQQKCDGV